MKSIPTILPVPGLTKKGGTYGAALTGKVADAQPANRSKSSLNINGSILRRQGAVETPRPGISKRPVGRPRVSAERRKFVQRMASNRYWHRVRAERAALGLNSRGGIPKKKKHSLTLNHFELHGMARKVRLRQLVRAQLYAAGLTALGTFPKRAHPKRGLVVLTPLERDYRQLRAAIPANELMTWDSILTTTAARDQRPV